MPNTSCLFGPAFSITGESYYSNTAVDFQVAFDNESDQALVLAYEWYLDNTLMIGQNNLQLTGKISCGTHAIGVRILSEEGWSGIKTLQFFTCKVPSAVIIFGPDSVYEGSSADYYVLQLYTDGTARDITPQYTLTSTTGGTFDGNVFTATVDDTSARPIEVTIGAVKDGVQQAVKQVTIKNTTAIVPVSIEIIGPDTVNEDTSNAYGVNLTYSDGSYQDLTSEYTFSATEGTFAGNILTIPFDGIPGNDRGATIFAAKSGAGTLSKQITINDPIVQISLQIVGVDTIAEGASAPYSVISAYSDGSQQDLTAEYTFSATVGTFTGNILNIPVDDIDGNTRGATISAAKSDASTLLKQITILDTKTKAGILVVDLFYSSDLNIIGLIDNAEVSVNHITVYTGKNFLPAASVPADAFILASDYSPSGANWRFEFNLTKLKTSYPGIQEFVMYLKGRAIKKGNISGSYSVRSNIATMTMGGSPGSYMPSVAGGHTIVQWAITGNPLAGDANNSYNESDLSTIIKFVYNVVSDEVNGTAT